MFPRGGPKDIVSDVRFSSSTASSGFPSGVFGSFAYGRKMVLKPLPVQLPVNAASGPRGAGAAKALATAGLCLTASIEKLAGAASTVARALASVIMQLSFYFLRQL